MERSDIYCAFLSQLHLRFQGSVGDKGLEGKAGAEGARVSRLRKTCIPSGVTGSQLSKIYFCFNQKGASWSCWTCWFQWTKRRKGENQDREPKQTIQYKNDSYRGCCVF